MNNKVFLTKEDFSMENYSLDKAYFQQLFENSPQGIVILGNDFTIKKVNNSFCQLFGYEPDELIGKNMDLIIAPTGLYKEAYSLTERAFQGEFVKKDVLRKVWDGSLRNFSVVAYPIMNGNQQVGIYAIYDDITKKKQYEKKLKLFASVLENNTEGVIITDCDNRITWVNHAFTSITGYTLQEVKGQNPSILKSGIQNKAFYENMWHSIRTTGYWKGEIWNKNKYNRIYPQRLNIFTLSDSEENINFMVGILTDITKEKEKDEKIYELAYRDSLTGLFNRESFNKKLTDAIDQAKNRGNKLAVLFLDLDDFKRINDNLGHSMGDNLLKVISENLESTLGDSYTVARIGGDEFTILIDDINCNEEIFPIVDRIIHTFSSPWIFDNFKFYLTTSIGISIFPEHGRDSDALIRNADIAMYKAKSDGSNRYAIYSPSMSEKTNEEFLIENGLRNALYNKEFSLHYQPIIDIKRKKVLGVEALLRWYNRDLGEVPPNKFIPIAEKNSLIVPIGEWVLWEACHQAKNLQDKGYPPLFVSVNVSAKQVQQDSFINSLSTILSETGLQPKYLTLEITEGFFMEDDNMSLLPQLMKIRALGVKLSIDDFGTGYSSFGKFSKVSIDNLKIDRSFIHNINRVKNNNLIIIAIIAMAKSLNMKVIAEGVETQTQLRLLKDYQCDMMQGYIHSHPMTIEDLEAYLSDH